MNAFRWSAGSGLCLGLMLSGCGSEGNTLNNGGGSGTFLPNAATVNRLEVVDPTPNDPNDPAIVAVRGFDAQGALVFGPVELPYSPLLAFEGLANNTSEVEVMGQRAPGHVTSKLRIPVNFVNDKDGVISVQHANELAGEANKTFTVKIVNNSDYPDDQVFVAVNGKDANKSAFYYLKFGSDGQASPLRYGPVANWDQYSESLARLRKEVAPHTYSFQCPYEDLVSGRVYLSFGRKLQGLGLNNPNDPLSLQLPSASGAPDYQTLYEFMEMSATSQPSAPNDYTLYANTSVVDFFSVGLGMTLDSQKNGQTVSEKVGFVDHARELVLAEFAKNTTPAVFQRYITVVGDASQIIRVLSPVQSVALDGPNSAIGHFLDDAINAGWVHYATVALQILDNLGGRAYGYQFAGELIGGAQTLNMTCTVNTSGDGQNSVGERYELPKPTSQIVFFCDDPVNNGPINNTYKNGGSEAHRRLVSLISAALNRGVFENYTSWATGSGFYTRPDGKYNWYSKIMHQFAQDGKVYGFGYDDVYGQDPTLVEKVSDVNQLTITIPAVARIGP